MDLEQSGSPGRITGIRRRQCAHRHAARSGGVRSRAVERQTHQPVNARSILEKATQRAGTLPLVCGHTQRHQRVTRIRWKWSRRRGAIGGIQVRNVLIPSRGRALVVFTNRADVKFGEVWQGSG